MTESFGAAILDKPDRLDLRVNAGQRRSTRSRHSKVVVEHATINAESSRGRQRAASRVLVAFVVIAVIGVSS